MKSVLKHWHRVLMLAVLLAALWSTGVMTAPVGDEKIPPAAEVARTAALVCKEGHCSTSEVPAPNMAQPEVADGEGLLRLRAGAFDPALGEPVMAPALMRALDNAQTGLRLVQFPGPIQEAWYAALEASGLHIITYIPDYAYLVWGNGAAVETVRMAAPLAWAGDYHPFYALHPDLTQVDRLPERVKVTVQVYAHSEAAIVIKDILARATVIQEPHPSLVYQNMKIEIAATDLTWLAALPGVVNVEPALEYQMMDEIQGQIMAGNLNAAGTRPAGTGYRTWLNGLGFPTDPANYPIVDVTDDGIDDGDATPLHTDFYEFGSTSNPDRLIYNYNGTTDASADGGGGHGNLNASIVAGYNTTTGYPYEDASGYNYGLGINPYGRVAGSKVFRNSGSWDYLGSNAALIGNSYTLGARISSNSWGADTGGGYTIDCQEYDALVRDALSGTGGNQEMIVVFSAGNAGSSGSNTIGSPGAAKNVITVGASENYRPLDTDGCSIGPTGANNAQDIINFSSRGPTDDSRIKPDVVAPGTHVMGAASKSPNFDGSGVCGPASGLYYPTSPAQTLYTWSSGTSHSTPAVAGAASLIYYYHETNFGGVAPSPALMKAYLVHATTYMTGTYANDTLPSNNQGYGLTNLSRAFDTVGKYVEDQGQIFGATGAAYAYYGNVEDSGEPVRVVLAWTDAPGPTTGNAYVNNLNLTVQISGETYLGNVFSGGASTTGGTADARNNVESVFLPAGFSGAFTVTVGAANIAGDGVPGNADTTDQDFALLVYNTSNRSDLVGYIAGTVTDSSTSATIANARVSVYFSTLTGADGKYRLAVISGTHTVTAQGYGYIPASATGVVVTTGMTTTQDFTLSPAPSYILTGTVTDASTGWALYASVEITPDGYPAFTVWTNPWTGVYSVTLAGSYPHTLTVEPWSGIPGYVGQSRQVNLSANRYNENFALAAGAPTCNAPGYTRVGLNEGFESATFPPTGWASFRGANGLGTGYDWVRTTTAYAGSGAAYVRYEDVTGGLAQDWLVTPQVHPTAGNSLLSFYMRQYYSSDWNTTYTIRVSTGSQTTHADFTTVRTYTETDFGLTYQPFTVDLSAYVDQDIYIAFVMEQDDGDNWYLDNVAMAACIPPTGGLIAGSVYNRYSHVSLTGATVRNQDGYTRITAATPADPARSESFYVLYSPAGSKTFTATMSGYAPVVLNNIPVVAGKTGRQDFLFGNAFVSQQTGNWSGSAWASGTPSANDWVTVTTGHVVTVDSATAACYGLTVMPGGTLVIPAGNTLTVEGVVQNNGTLRQTQNVAASGSTRFLNLQNQAGTASAYYGVDITPAAGSGSTTVEVRGNQAACTQNGGVGDTALLKRCFEIDTPVTNATVRFWYTTPELNGQTPNALRLWHYDGAQVWSEAGSGAYSYSGATCAGDCWVQRGNITAFSPFTVGGGAAPTAIESLGARGESSLLLAGLVVMALGLVGVGRKRLRR